MIVETSQLSNYSSLRAHNPSHTSHIVSHRLALVTLTRQPPRDASRQSDRYYSHINTWPAASEVISCLRARWDELQRHQ